MTMVTARDGTRLYCKVWGEGRPVVLVHGWPLSCDSWDALALALARSGLRAITYDRRGFGRSDQPWRGYDYDTFADDLADVMAACDVTDNAALVGFSMGGGEVARYMTRHGGAAVSQTALISSIVPTLLRDEASPNGVAEEVFAEMAKGIGEDRAHFMTGFFKDFFGIRLVARPVSQATLDWAWAMAMQAGLHPTLAALKAFSTADFRGDLDAFQVPTLVMHGTADKTVPIEATGHAVVRHLPDALLIEYQDEPHGLFATQPRALAADLVNFLDGGLERVASGLRQAMVDAVTSQSISTTLT